METRVGLDTHVCCHVSADIERVTTTNAESRRKNLSLKLDRAWARAFTISPPPQGGDPKVVVRGGGLEPPGVELNSAST